MANFYKVGVFEKAFGNKDFLLASNFEEKCIGQIIVKKGIFSAKEIISNFELPVSDGKFVNFFNVELYGRDLYIKKSDINSRNLVDSRDVEEYIDKFDYDNFCLNNELEINCKTGKKEINKIVKVIDNYKKNKRI